MSQRADLINDFKIFLEDKDLVYLFINIVEDMGYEEILLEGENFIMDVPERILRERAKKILGIVETECDE